MGLRGPKKGTKYKPTLDKAQAREALRAIVLREMDKLVASQLSHAMGLKFLVVREKKTGKFLRVGKGKAEALHPEEELIEVWEKDPSVQAFTDLMNRALDKPAEQVQEIKVTTDEGLIEKLLAGRARAAAARAEAHAPE